MFSECYSLKDVDVQINRFIKFLFNVPPVSWIFDIAILFILIVVTRPNQIANWIDQ